MNASENIRDHDKTMRVLHAWYCEVTGAKLALTINLMDRWRYWLMHGFTGEDLRKVMVYLKKQVVEHKRNEGCIKLSLLLDPEKFAEDLALCEAKKNHFFHEDHKIKKAPTI